RLSREEGLKRHEIAERLQISPNTVRNHLLAALKFIRLNIDDAAMVAIWAAILHKL
ncbi:MAG: hypothetical protein KGM98_05160, partial [Bacteroidota bacterium]|nr:hypothetical protein [Bacteroidota bacterium]